MALNGLNRELGIHTHNSMGIALQNTLRAYEEGVNWMDVTVSGMGRGRYAWAEEPL